MFCLKGVTLRPLELDDIDLLYTWDSDSELEMLSGWGPRGQGDSRDRPGTRLLYHILSFMLETTSSRSPTELERAHCR
jgi:hypothetical protein